ncbi:hypothetical protein [Flavobacterium crassostreae]|uniref:hypothetical protein n=1 Tax=Flavobacterium crassostreae TaxID=1763534 RepID=UPI0012FE1168|nr:hypothetical protein [Flavobacterium crassostreae]
MGTYKKNENSVKNHPIITSNNKAYKIQAETIDGKNKIPYFAIHFISNAGRINFV